MQVATISPDVVVGNETFQQVKDYKRRIIFSTPLPRIPEVWLAIAKMDTQQGLNVRIRTWAEDVSTEGFTLCAATWHNSIIWSWKVRRIRK